MLFFPNGNERFLDWNIDHWFRFGAGHCTDGYFLLAECTRHFNPVAGFNL